MVEKGVDIAPANGKLGILLVGLGAVSTTFVLYAFDASEDVPCGYLCSHHIRKKTQRVPTC